MGKLYPLKDIYIRPPKFKGYYQVCGERDGALREVITFPRLATAKGFIMGIATSEGIDPQSIRTAYKPKEA